MNRIVPPETHSAFHRLTPDRVLALVEKALAIRCTNLCRPLASYINRVYELESEDGAGLVEEWLRQVAPGVPGYVTPKVAVGAAVGNDAGQLLLIRRADSGVWLYPTGWADVGYSAAEVVVKEVREETGIVAEPLRLIAVLDGLRLGFTRIPLYSLVFHCRAVGGELQAHPLECADVGWFSPDALPEPLAGFERWGSHVFAALRGEPVDVLYDRVRRPLWRSASENPAASADTAAATSEAADAPDGAGLGRDTTPRG